MKYKINGIFELLETGICTSFFLPFAHIRFKLLYQHKLGEPTLETYLERSAGVKKGQGASGSAPDTSGWCSGKELLSSPFCASAIRIPTALPVCVS